MTSPSSTPAESLRTSNEQHSIQEYCIIRLCMLFSSSTGSLSAVGDLFQSIGLPVTAYSPPPIQWKRPIWLILILPVLYLSVLNALRGVLHLPNTDPKRRAVGTLMILFVVGFVCLCTTKTAFVTEISSLSFGDLKAPDRRLLILHWQ